MFLQCYYNERGERVYTLKVPGGTGRAPGGTGRDPGGLRGPFPASRPPLSPQKLSPAGTPTFSAHPARFSPDDRFSRHRLVLKRRFGVLLTQQPRPLL